MPKLTSLLLTLFTLFFTTLVHSHEPDAKQFVIAAMVYGDHNVVTLEGFKAGMQEKGYIEGRNTTYLFNGPSRRKKIILTEMKALVARKPDLIFAATTPVTRAAKKATEGNPIPVIFGPVNDPISAGIITDLRLPGGNITGVRLTDSIAKQVEWMLRLAPKTKRLFLPYNPEDKSSLDSLTKVTAASRQFGLTLKSQKVRSHEEIDSLLANFPQEIDGIFIPRDGMIMSRVEDFADIAKKRKLALSGTRLEMAKRGALFGFGFSGYELGKQMSRMADQVLHGLKPGNLPVETAEDYLSINLTAAEKMGLTIKEHILRQAHVIIRAP